MAIWSRRNPVRSSRPRHSALTAAGERVTDKRAQDIARLALSWQRRAFAYYDSLGEIKYAAQFFARLGKLELAVGEWVQSEDGERELSTEKARETPEAVAALERIRDPGGGGSRYGLLSSYGRIKFIAGEGYLFYTEDDDGGEMWEFLSTSEIRPNPLGGTGGRAKYQRIRAPQYAAEEYREPSEDDWVDIQAKEAIAYRFWRRHPQYSAWPDSPMRGVLDLCEELLILDRSARSRTLNRMAGNGILWLDDRLQGIGMSPPEPAPGEDPAEDLWLNDLTDAMVAPMTDEGDSGHAVPLLARVTVPPDLGMKLSDMVYHLKLTDPAALDWVTEERLGLINRIAIGLELPPEVLLGMGQANHWTAWEVSDDAWAHLEPYAQEWCDDLTTGYLIPTLRAAGVENPDRFAVTYDPARLRTEPEKAKDAKDLHDRNVIGDKALRDATGFTENDAPDEWETRRWLSQYSRDPGFALGEAPKGTTENPEERVTERVDDTTPTDGNETTSRPGGSKSETKKGPPDKPEPETLPTAANGNGRPLTVIEAHVLAACQVGLMRAREIAAARVVSKAKRDPAARDMLAARDGEHPPSVLGPERTRSLGGDPLALVRGSRGVLSAPLLLWGLTEDQVDLIVTAVEQHAALTLFDEQPRPFPPAVRNYIVGVVRDPAAGKATVGV